VFHDGIGETTKDERGASFETQEVGAAFSVSIAAVIPSRTLPLSSLLVSFYSIAGYPCQLGRFDGGTRPQNVDLRVDWSCV